MRPTSPTHTARRLATGVAAVLVAVSLGACSSDDTTTHDTTADTTTSDTTTADRPDSLTLVAYDSFTVDPSAFDAFTASTDIDVKIVTAGDAGTMLSKAALTAGNPEGDVMWGVDNTLLSRAIAGGVFAPYESSSLADLDDSAVALAPGHEVTPVDQGDVCINYDIAWFSEHDLAVPTSLDQLRDPAYADLLVVENPATSSPGLAFVLATIAEFGEAEGDGWQQYWKDLRANGVDVVDSWDVAYNEQFSGSSGQGPKPLVVSYGSSPPAEVIYGDPRPETAPTGVIDSTCFHQVEFAGVLRGTEHASAAGELIDFMVSPEFQSVLPLSLFVFPVRPDASLPAEFTQFAVLPADPLTVAPERIEENATRWIDIWTDTVLR